MTGAVATLQALVAEGADTIFGYPGGAIIPIYDALYDFKDQLNHVLVRHEQGGIHAAQGYARAARGGWAWCWLPAGRARQTS
ncbi:MAG: thiamine pyrophosphate-binding protein [Hymenobacter sp.]